MSKSALFWIITVSAVLLFGSYFFIAGDKNQKNDPIKTYTSKDRERPKIKVEKNIFDAGTIKVSDITKTEFTIQNTGVKPLQLFNISSSCGCTTGQIIYQGKESKEFGMHSTSDYSVGIAPGEKATVRMIYRPYVMPVYGPVEREVYVTTNDPDNQKLVFKMSSYVK